MIFGKKADDKFDQLYATKRNEGDYLSIVGNPLKVNDKKLLPQLKYTEGAKEKME